MKIKPTLIAIRVSALCLVGLSLFEIFNFFILSSSNLLVNNNYITIIDFIFSYGLIDLSRAVLWIFLLIGTMFFLIFGILLLIFTLKSEFNERVLSKYLFLFGMLTLVNSFIILAYIVFLGKVGTVTIANEVLTFQQLIYNPIMSNLIIAFMWYFFYIVICFYLMFGIFYSAFGLYWIISIEREDQVTEEQTIN